MRTKVLWSMAVVLTLATTVFSAETVDAKAGLAKRIKSLQNVMVTYDWSSEFSQNSMAEQNRRTAGTSFAVMGGVQRQIKICLLDGKVRRETGETKDVRPQDAPVPDPTVTAVLRSQTASSTVDIVVNGLRETLVGYDNDAVFKGFIRENASIYDTIFQPMGMTTGKKWIDATVLETCKTGKTRDGAPTLEFGADRGRTERWTLSPEHGYAPVVQEVVDANGCVRSRTEMSDWKQVGDVWVAYRAVETWGRIDGDKPLKGAVYTTIVKRCEVGSKENVPGLYKMAWPDGTKVRSKDGKAYEAKGGELKPIEAGAIESEGSTTISADGTLVVLEDGKKYRAKGGKLVPIEGK